MDRPASDTPAPSEAYGASATPIKSIPSEMRPREEFLRRGTVVGDDILLAILLRSGTPKKNVTALARELLLRAGSLGALAAMGFEELLALGIKGLGKVKAMELTAAFELGRRALQSGVVKERPAAVREPDMVYRLVAPLARDLAQEVFWVVLLDVKNRIIGRPIETTRGLINSSLVHPREVFTRAVRHAAAAVILAHNHPSGDPTPSSEDIAITKRLVEAARILGITVLDHVIIGRPGSGTPGYLSLRERGLVGFDP